MPTKLITPPAALAVSLEDAKSNLRIIGNDQDALITAWIEGITAHAEHYTGRSFINQTWRVTQDSFPDDIELPANSVSITNVKFIDVSGVEQTLTPADYFLDSASTPCYLVPAPGKEWPDTYDRINAVTVDVVCGYGATAASLPKEIKLYICAKLVEQFDPDVRPERNTVQASFLDRLLDREKVYA